MHSILHVIGARPHFMKLAPLYHAIQDDPDLTQIIAHTGQHYDHVLSGAFLSEFGLGVPDVNLGVGSDRHVPQMARIMSGLDAVLADRQPDIVFVYGDTNSTAAGAITAAKNHIPLAHVEAGLREFDKRIPEEINKLLTDAVTDLYFCPTGTAVRNLASQGLHKGVHQVGDTVIDWLWKTTREQDLGMMIERFEVEPGSYCVVTCHRASNTDHPAHLRAIWTALNQLDHPVIFPAHPRTRTVLERQGMLAEAAAHVRIIPPTGFWETQALLHHARAVLTDSGGIIKEAYFHQTPTVILDRQTEWIEIVEEGWAVIAGPDTSAILQGMRDLNVPDTHNSVLGGGGAARQIIEITKSYLNETP
ncbi:MAG: UDP-N-acetylglucosamine 2-epimerase (non-hydrolyzing) [Saprospiraceae bacterium]|nr:UDP-N-acetylglucosamine 2-epimerase (non-hydrolyzing) [Saprospiraceae bacterium]